MTNDTLLFLLGYLKDTQWASALKEDIDHEKVRELMGEQEDAFGLDTEYIEKMAADSKLLTQQLREDRNKGR